MMRIVSSGVYLGLERPPSPSSPPSCPPRTLCGCALSPSLSSSLSEEEKAPYEEQAAKDKERFQQEMTAFKGWLAMHPEAEEVRDRPDDHRGA